MSNNKDHKYELPKLPEELQNPQSEREQAYLDYIKKVVYQLQRDFATGLLHKEEFERRRKEEGGEGVYIFVDGDGLKRLNDSTQDHAAGDAVIRAIAQGIKQSFRAGDDVEMLPARMGGDEFIIFVKNVSPQTGKTIANRILDNIHKQNIADFYRGSNEEVKEILKEWPLKASLGVGSSKDEADSAMYKAKAAGRDRVELFEGSKDHAEAQRRYRLIRIATRLKNAGRQKLGDFLLRRLNK